MSFPPAKHLVLWLVRHGESDWNQLGIVQGHQDGPQLTHRGRMQADRAASLLASEHIGAIYSSDLRRARSTAATIADRVGRAVVTDDRLRERCFGVAEGSPMGSMASAVTGLDDGRVVDTSAHPVGGESLDDVFRRCRTFALQITSIESDGDMVIVAHGGSLRLLTAALTGSVLDRMQREPVPNGSVQRVVVRSGALDDLTGAVAGRTPIATEGGAP